MCPVSALFSPRFVPEVRAPVEWAPVEQALVARVTGEVGEPGANLAPDGKHVDARRYRRHEAAGSADDAATRRSRSCAVPDSEPAWTA